MNNTGLIGCVQHDCADCKAKIDALEAAVIAKLAQGVEMPEPFAAVYIGQTEYYYTTDQLRTAIAAARVQALEDAAECSERGFKYAKDGGQIADAIRNLIGATP